MAANNQSTTSAAPAKPTSSRRREASRANGRKSRGPVTPDGKARSARNAISHGLASPAALADGVCLANENFASFEALLAALVATHQPADAQAQLLTEELAVARWRQQRLWVIEAALFDKQLCTVEPRARETQGPLLDDRLLLALAFEDLADRSKALALLTRYEARLSRQAQRCLAELLHYKSLTQPPTALPNEPSPINEHSDITGANEPGEEVHPFVQHTEPAPAGQSPAAAAPPLCPDPLSGQDFSRQPGGSPGSRDHGHAPGEPGPSPQVDPFCRASCPPDTRPESSSPAGDLLAP